MFCDDCPDFHISSAGRKGIGVVQPDSGIDYPFVSPSDDIRELVANLILVLDSDNDEDWEKLQKPPFRVSSLVGAGCCTQSDGDGGVRPHIVIVNNDNDVVFNSTPPGTTGYAAPALEHTPEYTFFYDNDYNYFEWFSKWSYCKLVVYNSWPEQADNKRNYYYNISPSNAVIDSRAVTIRPRSVKRLFLLWPATLCEEEQRVNLFDEFFDTNIKFKSGYNIEMVTSKSASISGVTAQWTLNAVAGSGLGKYSNCDGKTDFKEIVYDSRDPVVPEEPIPPVPPAIVSLNGTTTVNGDALLLLKDCLWLKKAVAIGCKRVKPPEEEPPPEPIDPCNPPDPPPPPEMPCEEDEDGKHIKEAQVLDPETHGHAKIGGDCVPCCECKDYEETALKMNAYASQYALIGQRAVNVKDIHEQNVQKWRDIQSCSLNNPLRLLFVAQRCPYMDVVMLVCNPCSDECLKVKQLVLEITNPAGAVAVFQPGYTALFSSEVNGRPVPVDTTVPNRFVVNFAELKRGDSAYVRFRVKMSVASEYSITGVLTGVLDDDTPIMTGCASDENQAAREPAEAVSQQALQCDANGKTTLP